jgi:hypothetical protein
LGFTWTLLLVVSITLSLESVAWMIWPLPGHSTSVAVMTLLSPILMSGVRPGSVKYAWKKS